MCSSDLADVRPAGDGMVVVIVRPGAGTPVTLTPLADGVREGVERVDAEILPGSYPVDAAQRSAAATIADPADVWAPVADG